MKRTNKKGCTIAELLIVVAIIAVLVAIAIPVFGTLLERSREATDAANIRNSYAEAVAQLLQNTTQSAASGGEYKIQQTVSGWQHTPSFTGDLSKFTNIGNVSAGSKIQVAVSYGPSGDFSVSAVYK